MSIGIFLNVFARYPFVVLACLLLGGGILLGVVGLTTGVQLLNVLSIVLIVCGLIAVFINVLLKLGQQEN